MEHAGYKKSMKFCQENKLGLNQETLTQDSVDEGGATSRKVQMAVRQAKISRIKQDLDLRVS